MKRRKKGNFRIYLMLGLGFLFAPGALIQAQTTRLASFSIESGKADYQYTPYTEAEIEEALKRPLRLEDCIRIALRNNISLQIERGNLRMTEVDVAGSYGKFLPELSFGGSMQKAEENRPFNVQDPTDPTKLTFDKNALAAKIQQTFITGATLTFSGDLRQDVNSPDRFGAPPTRTQNKGFSIEITQPLLRDAWVTIAKSPITLSKQAMQIQEKQFLDAKLQTIFEVKRAYYSVLLQKELIKVHETALARDSTLIKLSESKLRANLATRRDVLSAEIRFAEDRAALIAAQTDYERALDKLKDVLGLPIEMEIELEDVKLSYSPEPLDVEVLTRMALENNPLIDMLHISIENYKLKHKIARNMLLPRVDLVMAYNGAFDIDRDQNKTVNSSDFRIALNFSYPFLDRASYAEAEKARIALQQEQIRLLDLQRQLKLSVREVVRSTYSSIEEIEALKRSIEAAQEKVEFATLMFNLGRASNLDVTDAQEALLKAQTQYVKKLIDYHLQLALLETLIAQPIVY